MTKTLIIGTRIKREDGAKFQSWCRDKGLNSSDVLRAAIYEMMGEEEVFQVKPRRKESRRKITITCNQDDFDKFEELAIGEKQTVSSLCGAVFASYIRKSPRPPRRERYVAMKALRQVMGIGTNINQIAEAMNRGQYTGKRYAPTKRELEAIGSDIQQIHKDFLEYGRGLLKFQTGEQND